MEQDGSLVIQDICIFIGQNCILVISDCLMMIIPGFFWQNYTRINDKSYLKPETVKIDFSKQKFSYIANIGNKLALVRYCEISGMLVICMSKLPWFYQSIYEIHNKSLCS